MPHIYKRKHLFISFVLRGWKLEGFIIRERRSDFVFYETWHRGNDCQPPHPGGILKINAAPWSAKRILGAKSREKKVGGAEREREKKVLIANRAESYRGR